MAQLELALLLTAKDSASPLIRNFGQTVSGSSMMLGLVSTAAVAAGTAMIGFGVASVDAARDYQKSMLQVQALAGVSAQQAQEANAAIMKLAVDIGQSPKSMADGFYYIASAGYTAKEALDLLAISSKASSAGNTQTAITANALTASLKAYGLPASEAHRIMDMMIKTVSTGKTEFEDYAKVIGRVSVNAAQSKVSLEEANAAFAILTNVMPSSAMAADSLNALLQTSARFDLIAQRAQKLGLAFDSNSYKSMTFIQRLQYLREVTDGNQEMMTKLLQRENATAAATVLLTNNSQDYATALKSITNAQGSLDKAFAVTQQGFDQQMGRLSASFDVLKIAAGNQLLPILTNLAMRITPIVATFAQWLTSSNILANTLNTVGSVIQQVATAVSGAVGGFMQWLITSGTLDTIIREVTVNGLALYNGLLSVWTVVQTQLVPAFQQYWNAIAPVVVMLAQLVAGIGLFGTGVAAWLVQSGTFIAVWNSIFTALKIGIALFSTIVSTAAGALQPVFAQLVVTIQTQLVPAFLMMWQALQPLLPAFTQIGVIIGGVLIVAFGLLLSVIGGLLQGLAGLLAGVIRIFGGIVQIILGVITVILGHVSLFVHMFTGQWDKAGQDLITIWNGVIQIIQGIFQVLLGSLQGIVGAIVGLIGGFISTILNFFMNLYNALVGHSIIPDLITGILQLFGHLASQGATFIAGFVMGILQAFGNLISQGLARITEFVNSVRNRISTLGSDAFTWGKNIVQGFINGIQSLLGRVGQVASSIAAEVSKYIKFSSPSEAGPGATLDEWGPNMVEGFASGIVKSQPLVTRAMTTLVHPLTLSPAGNTLTAPASRGNMTVINLTINVPGRTHHEAEEIAEMTIDYLSRKIRGSGGLVTLTSGGRAS